MINRSYPESYAAWFLNQPKIIKRRLEIDKWLIDKNNPIRPSQPDDEIEDFAEHFCGFFDNKCVYCETKINTPLEARTDHFRPRSNAIQDRNDPNQIVYNDYYVWLRWEWNNLYLACKDCDESKKSIFPVTGERSGIGAFGGALKLEQSLIIDPFDHTINPLKHFVFFEDGKIEARTERGAITIRVLELDRKHLCDARMNAAQRLKTLWDQVLQVIATSDKVASNSVLTQLEEECGDDRPFAGMKRQLLYRWSEKTTPSRSQRWRTFVTQIKRWNEEPRQDNVIIPKTFSDGYALLIGVGRNQYDPWSLPITVNDAKALRDVLQHTERCAYPADHIRLLYNEEATRSSILDGISWLTQQTLANDNTTAIIFFSGHGWRDKQDNYFLVPHDVDPNNIPESAISGQAFTAAIRDIYASRLLVILDCCHAGGVTTSKEGGEIVIPSGLAATAAPKALIEELKHGKGRAILSSSQDDELSLIVRGANLSLFTTELIAALEGAAGTSGDTEIWLTNLMHYLNRTVPIRAEKFGYIQRPFFDFTGTDFPIALLLGGKGLTLTRSRRTGSGRR